LLDLGEMNYQLRSVIIYLLHACGIQNMPTYF